MKAGWASPPRRGHRPLGFEATHEGLKLDGCTPAGEATDERDLALDLCSPFPSSGARGGGGEQILGVVEFGRPSAVVPLGDMHRGLGGAGR